MPASRIAFAVSDLMSEIRSLLPQDAVIKAELRLSPDAYSKVKNEITNYYGKQLVCAPLEGTDAARGGEWFKLGGLIISTVL